MTTEVAIMNRSAVALAADSAVTISTSNGYKVFDSANKLFELIKGRPVGVMIYNNADIVQRPWETVIKTYREDRRRARFDTLPEYTDDFLGYIRNQDKLFSEEQQEAAVILSLASKASQIKARINATVRAALSQRERGTDAKVKKIVKRQIEDFKEFVESWDVGPWSSDLPSERSLLIKHRGKLDLVIDAVFQKLPMSEPTKSAFRRALLVSLVRFNEDDDSFSGLVISGFGHEDYYPRLREYRVKGMLDGVLLAKTEAEEDISVIQPAYVESFAQGDMVRSFTVGIQDHVRREMILFWNDWLSKAEAKARSEIRSIGGLNASEAKELGKRFLGLSSTSVTDFLQHMQEYEDRIVKGELLQSLSVLPKDEMGAMAESLVNLTSLKRRVSMKDAQTVGGAVDVALVSRGDGFIWLKRKHYFEQTLNPNWAMMHVGAAPDLDEV
ncbi:hypothetical protein [Kribbella karoonensis]|uniref:Uncharacterized protein n=1 Tax=Kribbella karoonensis TaxID=324851 RepID=A0ABN2EBV2_9ACTN